MNEPNGNPGSEGKDGNALGRALARVSAAHQRLETARAAVLVAVRERAAAEAELATAEREFRGAYKPRAMVPEDSIADQAPRELKHEAQLDPGMDGRKGMNVFPKGRWR